MSLGSALVKASKRLSRAGLYDFLVTHAEALPSQAKVLSVGSGGEISDILSGIGARKSFDLLTSDIDPNRMPDIVDDISASALPSDQFDAVVISEVLEHVQNPGAAAAEIWRILKAGGIVIATTPFLMPIHDRPHDYYRFTRYGLAYLFRDFDEVEINARNGWAEALAAAAGRVVTEPGRRNRFWGGLILPPLLIAMPFLRLMQKLTTTDFLTSGYSILAKKSATPL